MPEPFAKVDIKVPVQVEPFKDDKIPIPVVIPSPTVAKTDAQVIDGKMALYLIYLLYKLNLVDRYGIKGALEVIKKDTPEDILKYLQAEIAKL